MSANPSINILQPPRRREHVGELDFTERPQSNYKFM